MESNQNKADRSQNGHELEQTLNWKHTYQCVCGCERVSLFNNVINIVLGLILMDHTSIDYCIPLGHSVAQKEYKNGKKMEMNGHLSGKKHSICA